MTKMIGHGDSALESPNDSHLKIMSLNWKDSRFGPTGTMKHSNTCDYYPYSNFTEIL